MTEYICPHGQRLYCLKCFGASITPIPIEEKKMSGCHIPLSEKEMHDNSLYTKMKELEIENKNLRTKIERLKDLLSEMIYKL